MLAYIVFILSLITIISSVFAIIAKKPANSIIFFLIIFLGTAGIFFVLQAEYLGIIQIIVYAGALLVVFVFALILVGDIPVYKKNPLKLQKTFSIILVLIFITIFWSQFGILLFLPGASNLIKFKEASDISLIARLLLKDYLLPFELASVILLCAIIGSLYIARKEAD
ncbi:MAG: NADH-quinone oxidoreductase subunit J [Candidatus Hydrogenedentota bacterium]